jgi:hypothetical protein
VNIVERHIARHPANDPNFVVVCDHSGITSTLEKRLSGCV